jgi:hypothetical protein
LILSLKSAPPFDDALKLFADLLGLFFLDALIDVDDMHPIAFEEGDVAAFPLWRIVDGLPDFFFSGLPR